MIRLLVFSMLVMLPFGAYAQDIGAAEEVGLANEAYAKFDNQSALQHYLKALAYVPGNYEALWKGARAYAEVGKAFEKSDEKKAQAFYQMGDSLARKAVEFYPDSAATHFALALCVGRVALFEGGKTKIRLSKEVRAEAEKALALDPQHDAAYHILGRWHYNIATLSWVLKAAAKVIYGGVPPNASLEQAAAQFAQAVALAPHKPVHRLEYGRTLIELGKYAEARQHLQKCMELAQVQWEDKAHQAEAAELLRKIKDKREKT